jgi:hypothetical protein
MCITAIRFMPSSASLSLQTAPHVTIEKFIWKQCKEITQLITNLKINNGRAMAQALSRRPLTRDIRVRSRVSTCGICGGQIGNGTRFSTITSVFPCQFHSTGAPLYAKTKKKKLIIFITGMHNNPQGCCASVASAAAPFTTKIVNNMEQDAPSLYYSQTTIRTIKSNTLRW